MKKNRVILIIAVAAACSITFSSCGLLSEMIDEELNEAIEEQQEQNKQEIKDAVDSIKSELKEKLEEEKENVKKSIPDIYERIEDDYKKKLAEKAEREQVEELDAKVDKERLAIITKENYSSGKEGQCTWYCYGRMREKCGIKLFDAVCNAKDFAEKSKNNDKVSIESEPYNNSIAVNHSLGNGCGHVVFIEHVTRDENGQPLDIYFTEANWPNNSILDEGDGILRKFSYEQFKKVRKPEEYIVPKTELEDTNQTGIPRLFP